MIYILDTHPLVWHLEANPKLSAAAAAVLSSGASEIIIPSIVLAEVWHLYHHNRITTSLSDVRSKIPSAANCLIYPLDAAVLEKLPAGFEIHDAIVVATGLVYRDLIGRPTTLITCDRAITDSKLLDVLW